MSLPMTKLPGIPDNSQVIDGMAFFAGSGPEGKTCGDCLWRGYYRQRLKEIWDERQQRFVTKTYKHSGCEKFKKMAGHHGPVVKADNKSCKFFEQKAGGAVG